MCFVLRLLRKGSFVVSLNFRRLLGAVFTPLVTAVCMVGCVNILSRLSWSTRNFKNIKKINVDRGRAGNKRRIFFGSILPLWTKPPKISPIKQPLLNQNKANCFNSLSACSQICFKPMYVPKPNTQTTAILPSRCGINAIPDRPARDQGRC